MERQPVTDEQRFFFDLRGWILLPAVLSQEEIDATKAECYGGAKKAYEGELQNLLDHPAIVDVLTDLLSDEPFVREDAYAFRCESSFITVRPPGWSNSERTDNGLPHVVRPPQRANAMRYQVNGGKIYSGLTRVVWELEEVREGQGGTTFLSGSHKAAFPYGGPVATAPNIGGSPWEAEMRAMMQGYSCPAGSALIFTESLVHAANDWTDPLNPRCAVFNCYNSTWSQWHRLGLDHDIIMRMPAKRRSLFRGVAELGADAEYSAENRAV
jgi:hypothetical protein